MAAAPGRQKRIISPDTRVYPRRSFPATTFGRDFFHKCPRKPLDAQKLQCKHTGTKHVHGRATHNEIIRRRAGEMSRENRRAVHRRGPGATTAKMIGYVQRAAAAAAARAYGFRLCVCMLVRGGGEERTGGFFARKQSYFFSRARSAFLTVRHYARTKESTVGPADHTLIRVDVDVPHPITATHPPRPPTSKIGFVYFSSKYAHVHASIFPTVGFLAYIKRSAAAR